MDAKNVYEEITEKMIKVLESGECPWKNPWKEAGTANGFPRNIKSNKFYRGINCWLLWCAPYESNKWGTFKQLLEAGNPVRKGEKATKIVFWKILDIETKDDAGEKHKDKIPLLKTYSVFNIEQTENFVKDIAGEVIDAKPEDKIESCENLISNFPLGMPVVEYTPGKAAYNRTCDIIRIPSPADYEKKEEYYHTFFHEAVHATGHQSRLNRETLLVSNYFGDDIYSQEELVAEMGASFLGGFSGILDHTIDNAAAYLRGWINALRGDSKLIVKAAAQAQRATDYLMNIKFEEKDE